MMEGFIEQDEVKWFLVLFKKLNNLDSESLFEIHQICE